MIIKIEESEKNLQTGSNLKHLNDGYNEAGFMFGRKFGVVKDQFLDGKMKECHSERGH